MNTPSSWTPLTERPYDPTPAPFDGIEFVLTPRERDQAKLATLYLEDRRRRLNERDAQRGGHGRR